MSQTTTHPRIQSLRATAARYGLSVEVTSPYRAPTSAVEVTLTSDHNDDRPVLSTFVSNLNDSDSLVVALDFLAELAKAEVDPDGDPAEVVLEYVHERQDEDAAYYAQAFATALSPFRYGPDDRPYEGRSAYKNEAVSA